MIESLSETIERTINEIKTWRGQSYNPTIADICYLMIPITPPKFIDDQFKERGCSGPCGCTGACKEPVPITEVDIMVNKLYNELKEKIEYACKDKQL